MAGPHVTVANAQLAVSGETGKYPEFAGNVLTVVPASVETPVNGLSGTRVGYKVDVDSLTVGL